MEQDKIKEEKVEEKVEEEQKSHENQEQISDIQFIDYDKMNVKDLMQMAQESFEKSEMEVANTYFEEAVKKDPDNEEVLVAYGIFLAENDEEEKAVFVFERAIQINPNTNYKKYLQLAQLKPAEEGLKLYQKAVQIMNTVQPNNDNLEDYKKDLSETYSAMAEIYQTDFIDKKESDESCISCITKALQIDSNSLDAYVQLANYYLNKEINEKAIDPIKKVITGLNNLQDNQEQDHYTNSFKIQAVKLCIEIEDFQSPINLLEHMRLSDDSNLEILYLLSFCHYKVGNYYTALELIEELQKKDLTVDDEISVATKELFDELNKQDFNLAKDKDEGQEGNQENNNEKDDDWMDLEQCK